MTGLYIHVPFCKKKCHYCDFVIALSGDGSRHAAYLGALNQEARHFHGRFAGTSFDTVYLGGGTPSTLKEDELQWLFHILKENFQWEAQAEITCEVNPGDVDLKKAIFLKKLGINRISLGAQSFDNQTLARINRTHHSGDIESAFRYLRDAGFKNINLDLILSLPGENWEKVRVSLEKACALNPEHFSIYELTLEEKTVFGQWHKDGRLELPDEDEQFSTLSQARAYLISHGFRHYELLNYAKPGFESRHNLLYWRNEEYLGLGPGAWSYFDGKRSRFAASYEKYLSKIQAGDWRPDEEDVLNAFQKEAEAFVLALRVTEGLESERFPQVVSHFADEITDLLEKGLLQSENGRLRLSQKGQYLAETVFAEFVLK